MAVSSRAHSAVNLTTHNVSDVSASPPPPSGGCLGRVVGQGGLQRRHAVVVELARGEVQAWGQWYMQWGPGGHTRKMGPGQDKGGWGETGTLLIEGQASGRVGVWCWVRVG